MGLLIPDFIEERVLLCKHSIIYNVLLCIRCVMVSNVSADILSDNYGRSDRPGAPSHLCRWAGSLSGGALPQTTRLLYSQPRGTTPHQPGVPNKPQSCTFCPHLRHLDRGDPHHTGCNSQAKRFLLKMQSIAIIDLYIIPSFATR